MRKLLLWIFLMSGLVALACIPAILYLESQGKVQKPFHLIQLLSCMICFPTSGWFLWKSKKEVFSKVKIIAILACLSSGAWFSYFVYVMVMMAVLGA